MRARAQFNQLKEDKAHRETGMIRRALMKALSGQPRPAKDGHTYGVHSTH